jgi:hypothetical protein
VAIAGGWLASLQMTTAASTIAYACQANAESCISANVRPR